MQYDRVSRQALTATPSSMCSQCTSMNVAYRADTALRNWMTLEAGVSKCGTACSVNQALRLCCYLFLHSSDHVHGVACRQSPQRC